jgi:hypothetical protein
MREVVQKFLGHEDGLFNNWLIRAFEDNELGIIRLEAYRDDQPLDLPQHTFELQSSHIRLQDNELDEATKTAIRNWLVTL